ncbi:hypothetical protein JCM21900_002384 [Sporobolomyces salmonicolor]
MGARASAKGESENESLAGIAACGRGPLANEVQPLSHRAEEVQVTKEDRQDGHDTTLLAFPPRGTGHTTPPSSSTNRLSTVSATEPGSSVPSVYSACNAYPPDSHETGDESAPLAATLSPPSFRTSSTYSITKAYDIPSLSSSNPRRAALAYSIRARAAETHELDPAGEKHSDGKPRRARETSRPHRKWLVALVALLTLFVCSGIGVGVGVGYGVWRHRGHLTQDTAASASALARSSLARSSGSVTPAASVTGTLVTSDGSEAATSVATATASSAEGGTNDGTNEGGYDSGTTATYDPGQ